MSELSIPALLNRDELRTPVEIESIDVRPFDIPLTHSFHIASDKSKNGETKNVLVEVRSKDGFVGLGEAAPFFGIAGDSQGSVLADIRSAISTYVDSNMNIFWYERLAREQLEYPSSRAAIEMALFDILAKRAEKPLAALLNPDATYGGHITDITIPIVRPDVAVGQATMYREQGFDRIKIKVGDDVGRSVQRIQAVVRTYRSGGRGWALKLLLDANEGFCPEGALDLLDRVDLPEGALQIFEQPVGRHNMPAMKRIAEYAMRMGCKVYADESVFTVRHLERVIRNSAAGGVNLKLMKHGGIIEAMRIAEIAEQSGLAVMVGGMVESRLAMTAGLHLAAALNVGWCDLDTPLFMGNSFFRGGMAYSGPHLFPPTTIPGIGISLAKVV